MDAEVQRRSQPVASLVTHSEQHHRAFAWVKMEVVVLQVLEEQVVMK